MHTPIAVGKVYLNPWPKRNEEKVYRFDTNAKIVGVMHVRMCVSALDAAMQLLQCNWRMLCMHTFLRDTLAMRAR